MWPNRLIKNDKDWDKAQKILNGLLAKKKWTKADKDLLGFITVLIQIYEETYYPIPDIYGICWVKSLMEHRGVNQTQLAKGAGISPSVLSAILNEKRPLNLRVIEKLANYFRVSPASFLRNV